MTTPSLPPGHLFVGESGGYTYALDEDGYTYVVGCHSERLDGGERIVTETTSDGSRKQWRVDSQGHHTPIKDLDDAVAEAIPEGQRSRRWGAIKRGVAGKRAEDRCREWADHFAHMGTPNFLWLWGPRGTGKSSIAALVVDSGLRRGVACRLADWSELLRTIKASWKDDAQRGDVIDDLVRVDLLVLDDVGKDQPTEWAAQVLFEIVNGRERRAKPAFFTSNYSLTQLSDRYKSDHGQFIVDRIGRQHEVELGGASNRAQAREGE